MLATPAHPPNGEGFIYSFIFIKFNCYYLWKAHYDDDVYGDDDNPLTRGIFCSLFIIRLPSLTGGLLLLVMQCVRFEINYYIQCLVIRTTTTARCKLDVARQGGSDLAKRNRKGPERRRRQVPPFQVSRLFQFPDLLQNPDKNSRSDNLPE